MTEHRISLFFDFTFEQADPSIRAAALTLAEVADPDWIHPDRLAADAARPIGHSALWDWTGWSLSPDLNATLRDTLGTTHDGTPSTEPLCLVRSASAKALLEGRYRGPPGGPGGAPGLVVVLGTVPRLRAVAGAEAVLIDGGKAGIAVAVEIETITLHLFRTGVGLAVPRLRLMPRERGADIPPDMLIEMVPRLGDERRRPSFSWRDGWDEPGAPRFALSTLVRRLLEPAGARAAVRERVYSYATIVCPAVVEAAAARDIAYRLSRHYGHAYHPAPDFPGTHFARPFETVTHAASREGCCTLVAQSEQGDVEFLRTWLDQADTHVYLPLQVAAVHEYVALLGMAQGAGAHIDPNSHDRRTIAALKALSRRFLLFRLRYRLLQVSSITAHELAFDATVRALGIDALSTKIARDLVEVERRLAELAAEHEMQLQSAATARERQRERKTAWLTGIASGALAYITMASLGDHFSEFLGHGKLASEGARFAVELAGQLAGLGLGAWSFYYAVWRKGGDHHEREHVAEHEAIEVSLARHGEAEEHAEHLGHVEVPGHGGHGA